MKRKILLVLCLVAASVGCVLGVAACKKNNADNDHVHSFSEEWLSDETCHWHECEICGFKEENEQHTISAKWSFDETQHWHVCKICDTRTDVAIHEFEDATCTECNYKRKAPDIRLNKTSVSLYADEHELLFATVTPLGITDKILWTSTDPSVATVSDEGYVTAVGEGTAKIIAGFVGGNTAECNVEVLGNINGLAFSEYGTGYAVTGFNEVETSVTVPASYKGKPVVAIGTGMNDGFSGCENILSVVLPDTVTEINYGAFSDCIKLNNLTLSACLQTIDSYAFKNCANLKNIILPEGITTIGSYAFYNCASLSDIIIPKGIKSVAYETFWQCTSLSGVYLPEGITDICANAFNGCSSLKYIALPESVQLIDDFAFRDCTGLLSIIIGDGVTSLGKYAFQNCTALKSATMGDGVEQIGEYAFSNCTSLKSIVLSGALKSIGDYSFNNCSSLKSITVPEKVSEIGKYAFASCSSLSEINFNAASCSDFPENNYVFASANAGIKLNIGNNVTKIPANLFYACCLGDTASPVVSDVVFAENGRCVSIGVNAFRNCSGTKVYISDLADWCGISFENEYSNPLNSEGALYHNEKLVTDIILPDSVSAIGNYTFCGGRYIRSVAMNKVVAVGDYAFRDCYAIENIDFGKVESIGNFTFAKCTGIEEMSLPETLEVIGDNAFENCTGLIIADVGDGVNHISRSAFENCTNLLVLTLGNNIAAIEERAFYNCVKLTVLNYNAANCADLSADNYVFASVGQQSDGIALNIGSNVTAIPDNLFNTYGYVNSYAANVTALAFAENSQCQSIGANTFKGCPDIDFAVTPSFLLSYISDMHLKTLVISEGDSIEFGALKDFTDLESLMLPYVGSDKNGTQNKYFGYIFGATAHYDSPSYYLPVSLKDVIISGSTEIYDYAFCNCDTIQNIILGDGVSVIGFSAFANCTGLETVRIGDGVKSIGESAFIDCGGLKNIYIGDGAESIGHYAFSGCTNLETLIVGADVKTICDRVFDGCTSLKRLVLPDGVTSIGSKAFNNCNNLGYLSIPDSISYIGNGAFDGCDSLIYGTYGYANYLGNEDNPYVVLVKAVNTDITSCTIHESTKIIYDRAFKDCVYITEAEISYGVKQIGASAFNGCYRLEKVEIPYGVTYIGADAFYYCTSLKNISVPESVSHIGVYAFHGCGNLVYNEYGNGCYIGNEANPYAVLVKATDTDIVSCNINVDTRVICDYAFYDCNGLTEVAIPGNVKYIGQYAFINCYGLSNVIMGNGITEIDDYAFLGCSGLNTVYFTGTSAQWSAMNIGTNDCLTNSKIYFFSYFEPTGEDGNTITDTFWHFDSDGVTPVIW